MFRIFPELYNMNIQQYYSNSSYKQVSFVSRCNQSTHRKHLVTTWPSPINNELPPFIMVDVLQEI